MITSPKDYDQKIRDLQQKKKDLETKQALAIYKKSHSILGDAFSPELSLMILEDAWKKASPSQKEVWRGASKKFPKSTVHKNQKKSEVENHDDQSA